MQTVVRMIAAGVMLALLAGIAVKLKIFIGGPQHLTTPYHHFTRTRTRTGP